VVPAPAFTLPINVVGQMNLTSASASATKARATARPAASAATARYATVDDRLITHGARGPATGSPSATPVPLSTKNVAGELGFSGITGVDQTRTFGGLDLEPPDQGLCAGGGYVVDFVNNALAVYDQYGDQLVAPVGSPALFLQPSTAFMSDPRCYYDAPTKRWFLQEFVIGTVSSSGQSTSPSLQFEAVSNTPDPTGTYTVYSWDTTDTSTAGCPCFGDYDNLGADANGIYVATDEFSIATPAYNGVIIYAISKAEIETAGQTGILPPVVGYRLTQDRFGQPEIVAPTTTPAGGTFATNTEYFVESNQDSFSDHRLQVYALNDTSLLPDFAPPVLPTMYRTIVDTEAYAMPADATQKPGPRPLGRAYQAPAGGIQADFDAEMEPTFVDGQIHAELDTATAGGNDGVDWFILKPSLSGTTLTATVVNQGLVKVRDTSLLYPYTALDSHGTGYLLFSLSGPHNFPSPAYISYSGSGPTGPVMIATPGAAPEDGFTCYAAFVGPGYGGCRWGDYSMGVAVGSRIYMATEFIPQQYRDTLTNWGTYVWSAPAPKA
jgi:hypothetical protein